MTENWMEKAQTELLEQKEKNTPNIERDIDNIGSEQDVTKRNELIIKLFSKNIKADPLFMDNLIREIMNKTGLTKKVLEDTLKTLRVKIFKQPLQKSIVVRSYKPTTLSEVKSVVKKWLSIDDEDWLEIILSVALDRKINGEPIWLFIIAVPSGTKTEILRAFEDGTDFYHLSSLTVNSLVSGYVNPDGSKVEDLATQLDNRILILKDFTSVLSMPKEKRNDIIGQLREFYDGSYDKKFGNMDHKVTCNSKFGLIAGVTPKIDQFHSIMGSLGERFLKLRSDFDEDKMLFLCEKNEGFEKEMREEISVAIMGFITHLVIKDVTFNAESIREIKRIAKYVSKLRTPDYSRWEGDSFVSEISPQPEKPTRVYKQLKKLAKALCCINGLSEVDESILKKVWRVARDSIPPDRQIIVNYVFKKGMALETDICRDLKVPRTSARRILEFLGRLQVFETNYSDNVNVWWGNVAYAPALCKLSGSDDPEKIQSVGSITEVKIQ